MPREAKLRSKNVGAAKMPGNSPSREALAAILLADGCDQPFVGRELAGRSTTSRRKNVARGEAGSKRRIQKVSSSIDGSTRSDSASCIGISKTIRKERDSQE